MSQRLTTSEFVKRAIAVHGKMYDYTDVVYHNSKHRVMIGCNVHGKFVQQPTNHLSGNGCPKCAINHPLTHDEFVTKANIVHTNIYEYVDDQYSTATSKIDIVCKIHGTFQQSPNNHLAGHGCPQCKGGVTIDHDTFVIRATQIHHNRYNYPDCYVSSSTKLRIICHTHGEFYQRPNDHLSGGGCPRCSGYISQIASEWLDSLGIPDDSEHREVGGLIQHKRYVADGYDPDTNTVYEFHGDYWHGSPKIYKSDDVNPSVGKTYGQLYIDTVNKKNAFSALGYSYVEIWESEWKKQIIEESL